MSSGRPWTYRHCEETQPKVSYSDQLLLVVCAIIIVDRNRKPGFDHYENLDDETLVLVAVYGSKEDEMRSFWEQTGVLGPTYRLLAKGLNEDDIAVKLNLPGEKVQACVAWILHFLKLKNRQELVLYASTAA